MHEVGQLKARESVINVVDDHFKSQLHEKCPQDNDEVLQLAMSLEGIQESISLLRSIEGAATAHQVSRKNIRGSRLKPPHRRRLKQKKKTSTFSHKASSKKIGNVCNQGKRRY